MKLYVASSWRNHFQPFTVSMLREEGHEVYDFRHPADGDDGFHWSEIDPAWKSWGPWSYITALQTSQAEHGFKNDWEAMQWADAFVLQLPCGRSAHLELGWAVGAGKHTAILLDQNPEPELMYKMVDLVTPSLAKVINWLREF